MNYRLGRRSWDRSPAKARHLVADGEVQLPAGRYSQKGLVSMSAYIVGKEHIDALVTAAVRWGDHGAMSWYHGEERHEARFDNADEIGAMLWAENAASVAARYPDIIEEGGEWPGPIGFGIADVMAYRFDALRGAPDPLVILKAIQCFEYQSCEHAGWETSSAKAFCSTLTHWGIDQLPGMREAPGWDIDDRDVFVKRALVS